MEMAFTTINLPRSSAMRKVLNGTSYNGYPLSKTRKNDQGFYKEILQSVDSLLEYMIRRHSSVFLTMFIVKYPAGSASRYPNDNVLLSKFTEALIRHCTGRHYDPKYLWVRELSSTGQIHYHFMLLLDSNMIQNTDVLIRIKATEIWQRCLGIEDGRGLVHLCPTGEKPDYGGIKLKRKDPQFQQKLERCYQWASYLAKCYSKGATPAYVNEVGCSRLN